VYLSRVQRVTISSLSEKKTLILFKFIFMYVTQTHVYGNFRERRKLDDIVRERTPTIIVKNPARTVPPFQNKILEPSPAERISRP